MTDSQRIGIAVSRLVSASKESILGWVRDAMRSAALARAAVALEVDGPPGEIEVPSDDPAVNVPFVISGSVSPAADGEKVQLERYYGGKFRTVATAHLDDSSHYVFAQVFGTAGARTYRVTKPAGRLLRPASAGCATPVTGGVPSGRAARSSGRRGD